METKLIEKAINENPTFNDAQIAELLVIDEKKVMHKRRSLKAQITKTISNVNMAVKPIEIKVKKGGYVKLTPEEKAVRKFAKSLRLKSVIKPVEPKIKKSVLAKMNTTYSNEEGKDKQSARDIMEGFIIQNPIINKPIITLSASKCIFERQLLKNVSNKLNFLACECEPNEYNDLLMTVAKNNLPISTYRGYIGDQIAKASANEYSHAILDYCGQFGKFHKDIQMTLEKDIVEVGGFVCITLNKRISTNFEIYDLMEKLNPIHYLSEGTKCEHAITTFINRVGGMRYAITKCFNYKDDGKASMLLVIVKRIK